MKPPVLDIFDYEECEVLKNALNMVCKYCADHNCDSCEIIQIRKNVDLLRKGVLSEHEAEPGFGEVLPDEFTFRSLQYQSKNGDTYYAKKENGRYSVTLPNVGIVCYLTNEEMQKKIRRKKFAIITD